MSYFLSAVKRAMKEKDLRQIDIQRLTKGIVKQPMMALILGGDSVPQKMETIDALAKALKMDIKLLRKLAILDILEPKLIEFGLSQREICVEAKSHHFYSIPMFNLQDLKSCLTLSGYPINEKATGYLRVAFDYGEYAYAAEVQGSELFPRVQSGEIMILSQDYPLGKEDYGIVAVRSRHDVLVGKIKDMGKVYTIETHYPYQVYQSKKSEVVYAHRVVDMSLIPYSQRKDKLKRPKKNAEDD